jgi:hypothetical protein
VMTNLRNGMTTKTKLNSVALVRRCHHEAEWTPFENYFSENMVVSGIEPRTSGSAARNSGHWTIEAINGME